MKKLLSIILFSLFALPVFSQNAVSDADEFDALQDLWNSTSGSSWTTKTGWPREGNWLRGTTAATMDGWYGIVVTNGDITEITLNSNNLSGTIPSSISKLTKLKVLNLSSNKLTGQIP